MNQTSTSRINDLIRYVYFEKSANQHLLSDLLHDKSLLDFYIDAEWLKSEMNKIQLEPKESSIQKILNFSQNYEPVC